jgi:hypothetical protein
MTSARDERAARRQRLTDLKVDLIGAISSKVFGAIKQRMAEAERDGDSRDADTAMPADTRWLCEATRQAADAAATALEKVHR